MTSIPQILDDFTEMVSFPAVYLRAKEVMEDPESSINDLVQVISIDPGLTARVLRLVNSAIFGFPGKIETLSRAVNILGTVRIHDLVLATSVANAFGRLSPGVIDMKRFWHGSVYCGLLSQTLATRCNLLDAERLFVEGLLRDLGHLVLFEVLPETAERALMQATAEGRPVWQVEREVLGFDFAQLAAALFQRWKLPEHVSQAVGGHTDLQAHEHARLEAAILHIAGAFADGIMFGHAEDAIAIDTRAWQLTGLAENVLPGAKADADQALGDVMELILGPMQRAA